MNRFAVLAALAALSLTGCKETPSPPPVPVRVFDFETSGEEFLIASLDEIHSIADSKPPGLPRREQKKVLLSTAADTVYIYGELTPEGYGSVVTERHAYPKGLLLITVRKSYGKPPASIVTQTRRYISFEDFAADSAQQSSVTEIYGLSSDTIVTHVQRNGILETYTFRLPVVTRVTKPDGSVRVTTRYGAAGAIRSEVRDGNNNLIQIRITSGETDGSLIVYTEFADGSWRNVRTVGRADGSVYRDITSGP